MKYRLLALDLDGTLLHENLTMSPRVRAALLAARDQGVRLVLASGRGYPSMKGWAQELGLTTPLICYQGAVVAEVLTGHKLHESTFALDIVREVRDFGRALDLELTLYVNDEVFVERKRQTDAYYEQWFGLPVHIVPDLMPAIPGEPNKFIIIGEGEDLDRLRPEVDRRFGERLQIVRSHRFFLEGLAPGATKGAALAWLAKTLGIPREETMAIGDSGNDAAMIAWAGLGVAMGNASPEARAVADYIAPTIHEDGAAVAIERFCLDANGPNGSGR